MLPNRLKTLKLKEKIKFKRPKKKENNKSRKLKRKENRLQIMSKNLPMKEHNQPKSKNDDNYNIRFTYN